MITLIIIIVLLYTNFIRFLELKEYTTMQTWKQYWFKKDGIVYSVNLITFILIIYFISKYLP